MKLILNVMLVFSFLAAEKITFAQDPGALEKIVPTYNDFGVKLLAQVRESVPGKNVFLSPIGLAFALSMAVNGAEGQTRTQIVAALQLDAGDPEFVLNMANPSLVKHLSNLGPKIKLEIANSLWTAKDAKIKATYMDVLRENYQTEAFSVDFNDPATANKINDWCSERTHGKIPKMVEPPLRDNRLIILDAIYFKGDWTVPFDKKLTHDLPFTLADGRIVTHPRMSRTGEFQYSENDEFQAVRLPYAGQTVSMYVFLPKKGLADFLKNLTAENLRQRISQLHSQKGTVELPRFKLENDYDLKQVLAKMGMPVAFSRQANFKGISDEPLYIGWVKQKTFVDVNEEGTEAAAVTGIGIMTMAIHREPPPFQMVVDRPFFLAIRDNQSGVILFLGAIIDPR